MSYTYSSQEVLAGGNRDNGVYIGGRRFLCRNAVVYDFSGANPTAVYANQVLDAVIHPFDWGSAPFLWRKEDNRVFAIGGSIGGGPTSICYAFELSGDNLSMYDSTAFPIPIHGGWGGMFGDGRLLHAGGSTTGWAANNTVRLGTISGINISWATASTSGPTEWIGPWEQGNIATLADGRILVSSNPWYDSTNINGHTKLYFLSVSGTTITAVAVESPATKTSGYNNSMTLAQLSDGRVVFGLGVGPSNTPQYALWTGVISGNSITWTAEANFPYSYISGYSAISGGMDNLKLAVMGQYEDDGCITLTFSGGGSGVTIAYSGADFYGGTYFPRLLNSASNLFIVSYGSRYRYSGAGSIPVYEGESTINSDVTPAIDSYYLKNIAAIGDNLAIAIGGDDGENPLNVVRLLQYSSDATTLNVYDAGPFPFATWGGADIARFGSGKIIAVGFRDTSGQPPNSDVKLGTISGTTVSWASATLSGPVGYTDLNGSSWTVLCPLADGRVLAASGPTQDATRVNGYAPLYFLSISGSTVTSVVAASPRVSAIRDYPYVGLEGQGMQPILVQLSDGRLLYGAGGSYLDDTWNPTGLTEMWVGTIAGNNISWVAGTSLPVGDYYDAYRNSCALLDNKVLLSKGVAGSSLALVAGNGNTFAVTQNEASSADQVATLTLVATASGSEPSTAGQTSIATQAATASQSDSAAAAQTSTVILASAATQSESASAGQTSIAGAVISSSRADAMSASDSTIVSMLQITTQTDAANAAQTSTAAWVASATQSEPASAAQTSTVVQAASAAQNETSTAAQTSTVTAVAVLTQSEGSTANQTSSAVQAMPATQNEGSAAAQTSAVSQAMFSTQTDASNAGSTQVSGTLQSVDITDNGALTETETVSRVQSVNISEAIAAETATVTQYWG